MNVYLSSKIAVFILFLSVFICGFDIEMLVVCVDIGSSVG